MRQASAVPFAVFTLIAAAGAWAAWAAYAGGAFVLGSWIAVVSFAAALLLAAAIKYLEDELKIPVDVTTRDGLHPMLKAEIEGTALRVF